MGKKGRLRKEKETEAVKRYQWEFLRRNSEYRHDYEAFIEEFGDWLREKGFWYHRGVSYQGEDREFFWNVVILRIRELCLKWQLYDLYPPDWQFDRLGRPQISYRPRAYLPTGPAHRIAEHWDAFPPNPKESLVEKVRRDLNTKRAQKDSWWYLNLSLDVRRPVDELLDKTRRAIQFHRRRYEDELEKLIRTLPKRRRLDKYAEYLEVWDLRGQGLTFEQIAQRVYPVEYEAEHHKGNQPRAREAYEAEYNRRFEGLVAHGIGVFDAHTQLEKEFGLDRIPRVYNPIVQRVRDHFARAKELVEGGYKELE